MQGPVNRAVGIDLGTTYSVLAVLDSTGRPVAIPNAEGDLLTPSAVLFTGENVVVGKEAIKAQSQLALQVADAAKRELGERVYHRPLAGEQLAPEVIQAYVLYKLRCDAARQLGLVQRAVVTVPAYFDEHRRRLTQDAGVMAGLEVLDIINEPTAAALAFGHRQGFLSADGTAPAPLKLLVYDLGGGTFDVTIMELRAGHCMALATDGDSRLGGRDWDERLIDHAAEQFMREFDLDPRRDANARARLARECEDVKRTLSSRSRATVAFDWQGKALRYEVTQRVFQELTRDLLERTRFTTRTALGAAGLAWGDIDRVLLVGGSTRMPMVSHMLRKLSGQEPDASVAADEAVAQGAALWAGQLLDRAQGNPARFHVRNVNSHSLGVLATDPKSKRRQNACIIPKNTPLPVAARRVFRTQRTGQRSLLVQVVEGEAAAPDSCSPIARCVVRDLPPQLPAHTPIDVRFGYRADGTLSVEVHLPGDTTLLTTEITHPNSMSRAELLGWRSTIEANCAPPADEHDPSNVADTN